MKPYHRPLAGKDSLALTRIMLANNTCMSMLSREQIRTVQEHRLRNMIACAKKNSAWYNKRLQHIDPSNFSLEQLTDIPIMNKRDVMDHWDDIVADKRLTLDKASAFLIHEQKYELFHGHHLFASGGSSGRRGMFVWDANEIALTLASLYQYQYRDEFHYFSSATDKPLMIVSIGALRPVHLSETVLSLPIVEHMQARAFSALDPIEKLVENLNDCQPTHLNGYPSVITRLAARAIQGDLNINPLRILVGAEPLLPDMINTIKKAWKKAKLINNWGSTDAGIHAVACDKSNGNLHLCEDMILIEAVDENNRPVQPGERSAKVLVTNLFRKSMPIFRYEMDDRIIMLKETCRCGSLFQLIHSIDGRSEDDFIYGDVIVIAEVFENAIMIEPGIDEYQVIQTQQGADILIVPDKRAIVNKDRILMDLTKQFKQLGVSNPIIQVHLVEQLKRHEETGKLKRFKCLP